MAAAPPPPAEIQFAQRLTSSEKGTREQAVRKLRRFIGVKTQTAAGFSQEELLKIWKGLFYCMWMQDQPLLQEELAGTISQLIHVVVNLEAQHLFIQTFWQTMNREWDGLERRHLDKFHLLTRVVLRESFEVLKRNDWEDSRIKLFLGVLMQEVVHPANHASNGVKFHFIDIYLAELAKVGAEELTADQNLKFIDPFCKITAKTKDPALVQTIAQGIFEAIVAQSPFAVEAAVEERQANGDGGLLTEEEEVPKKTASRKAKADKDSSRKAGLNVEEEPKVQVGSFENSGPVLQFNYKAVADRLCEMTSKKNIPPFNRRRLCKLIRKFQDLAEGNSPRDSLPEDVSADEDDGICSQGKPKKKEVAHLEKAKREKENDRDREEPCDPAKGGREAGLRKRKRKKKKRNGSPRPKASDVEAAVPPEAKGSGEPASDGRKGQKREAEASEPGSGVSGLGGRDAGLSKEGLPADTRRKRPEEHGEGSQEELVEAAVPPAAPSALANGAAQEPVPNGPPAVQVKSARKKQRFAALAINGNGLSPHVTAQSLPKRMPASLAGAGGPQAPLPQKVKVREKKTKLVFLDPVIPCGEKPGLLKKRKKAKRTLNSGETNGGLEPTAKTNESSGTYGPAKKAKLKTENDFVKFESTALPKPVFFRKAKSNASISSPTPTVQSGQKLPSTSKKVTFGLNKNMTAEFRKTDKSILVSPSGPSRVAFNPKRKPLHGVLKTPTGSPSETPLMNKKSLFPPQRRPTAMDFF
ncbi:ribosomal RNA processing protein 1 homolog B isoform X1 [Ornithorhynchus anatinus]|uniref:Ribosomal RNA processing 1B n=1 Tax=Ornithorhynchus anatinus TaxID=9258 RepID=F6R342_ORNAN|nr:ribosomal RNA processing protein 1 homolog B isoform X1 [Ornithorhynchus anatinus]